MRSRSVVFAAAAAALLALPATASAGPVCNLVKDKDKDAYIGHSAAGQSATAVDIKSVDVATGKKTLVVVLRMASTKVTEDPATMAGMTWEAAFSISGTMHRFFRRTGPNGQVVSETATADGTAIAGLTVKTDGNAITWTVPRANVPKLKTKKAALTGLLAGATAPGIAYDQAPNGGVASNTRYVDMTASCVKPA